MSAARPDGGNAKRKWSRERASGIGAGRGGGGAGVGVGGAAGLGPGLWSEVVAAVRALA